MREAIEHRLGWLDAPGGMVLYLAEIEGVAASVHRDGLNQVCLLGMGGSSLCAEVLRLTLAAATGMDRTVEMAAVSLGAGGWTLFRRVTLPLILPGVISGWALAFIQSFDDLTMTVFLAAPGTETLPVRMFLYIQDNIDPLVTSVSASVIAITIAALMLLDRFYGLERVLAGHSDRGR